MFFDQAWMTELLELQKKAADLARGKNTTAEVQSMVMEVLKKWGINNLPWDSDSETKMGVKDSPERKSGPNFNIDISETKNNVLIQAAIPDIKDKNDLSIKLWGDTLMITGKCTNLMNTGGSFCQKLRLPANVTVSGAEATYRNGNLTISLPKMTMEDGEIIPLNFFEAD